MIVSVNGEPREMGLREAWEYMTEAEWKKAAREAELEYFRDTHKFCGSCGSPMQQSGPISMRCPACGREDFPALAPAMVVLVTQGNRGLLVHARNFKKPMYALVAGFVETGENLEECVAREVMEETSLKVKDIKYFGSQTWPFPSQLMIGFTAVYESGEITFADGELEDGGWFDKDNHPLLPTMPSLSRQLIDAWIKGDI